MVALILTLSASVIQILIPRNIGRIINIFTQLLTSNIALDWEVLGKIGLTLVILYVFNFLSNYISSILMVRVSQSVIKSLRNQMQVKLNALTLKYFDSSSAGVWYALSNDLDNVKTHCRAVHKLSAIVLLVGVVIMTLIINPILVPIYGGYTCILLYGEIPN